MPRRRSAYAQSPGRRKLSNAIEEYGDYNNEISIKEWNARKYLAELEGKWRWKQASNTSVAKTRIERESLGTAMQNRIGDVAAAMDEELNGFQSNLRVQADSITDDQCTWQERLGGKAYRCVNPFFPKVKGNDPQLDENGSMHKRERFCLWHVRECVHADHPLDKSKSIEIPNAEGLCLGCYESTATEERGTLQRVPARVRPINVPGVFTISLIHGTKKEVYSYLRRGGTLKRASSGMGLHAQSLCRWQKEHSGSAYLWKCTNRVLGHPSLPGSFLSFCGYHTPKCIHEYKKSKSSAPSCTPIHRLNSFGMCRNHLESYLATLTFDKRSECVFASSEFDVPGLKECKRESEVTDKTKHPLAPKHPLSTSEFESMTIVKSHSNRSRLSKFLSKAMLLIAALITVFIRDENRVLVVVKDLLWRIHYARRAPVVATRIQRIFRGNRSRRRVREIRHEMQALQRIRATKVLQTYVRRWIGRQEYKAHKNRVISSISTIHRIWVGAIARKTSRRLKACLRIQRNYRSYRQRLLAWAFREEMLYMRDLQKEADRNLIELEVQIISFRRWRARHVLSRNIRDRKRKKAEEERSRMDKIHSEQNASAIQIAWMRYRRRIWIHKRFYGAISIQKMVKGWLTRHMWRDDPGILSITHFVNERNGFQYGKTVVLYLPSRSYAVPTMKIRTLHAALNIQRVYRGHTARLVANTAWVRNLRLWNWVGLTSDSSDPSTDCMAIGKNRYGFMLPIHGYNRLRDHHMIPIARDIRPTRGFAYQFQGVLDLINDRDRVSKKTSTDQKDRKVARKHTFPPASNHHENQESRIKPKVVSRSISIEKALSPVHRSKK